jgi:hypothetical protein
MGECRYVLSGIVYVECRHVGSFTSNKCWVGTGCQYEDGQPYARAHNTNNKVRKEKNGSKKNGI